MTATTDMELKIIEAAIACIERMGIRETTVRKIAQEAGVNVAAINYYFRSKEQLMERVRETTLNNAFDWSHFAESEDAEPKERLVAILDHLTTGAQNYPQIARSHFVSPLVEDGFGKEVNEVFTRFANRIYDDLVARGVEPGDGLRSRLVQAMSATILGIGLHVDLWSAFYGRNLRDPEVRHKYIVMLVNGLL